jgi:hypothetical protein
MEYLNIDSLIPADETRDMTILRHYENYQRTNRVAWKKLMAPVVEHYIDTTGRYRVTRNINFEDHRLNQEPGDAYHTMTMNAQRIARLFETGEITAHLEESLVLAAPVAMRENLIRDLCARWEILPMDNIKNLDKLLDIYTVVGEGQCHTGLSTQLLVQMLQTGDGLGPEDQFLAPEAMRAIEKVISTFTQMHQLIKKNVLNAPC